MASLVQQRKRNAYNGSLMKVYCRHIVLSRERVVLVHVLLVRFVHGVSLG